MSIFKLFRKDNVQIFFYVYSCDAQSNDSYHFYSIIVKSIYFTFTWYILMNTYFLSNCITTWVIAKLDLANSYKPQIQNEDSR